jgi:NAD(P)H-dependent FMN reductase
MDEALRDEEIDMPTLMIIIASTRPGRAGLPIAEWFEGRARAHGGFEIDVADLLEIDLPFVDEPNHPRLRQYTQPHTLAWSARVDGADAFAFVAPEYNHGLAAPLKNAIDFLHEEWRHKPVGFVSYGGVSAGARAVQMTKPVAAAVGMVPVVEAVSIPFFPQFIDEEGRVQANETMEAAASDMLDALAVMEGTLRPLRLDARQLDLR